MAVNAEQQQAREQIRRIESLLQEVERFRDPEARKRTREIVQLLMDFHGAAIEKMLEHLAAAGDTGLAQIDLMARDEAISSLMLLYGLHPLDLETRVRQAIEHASPYVHAHGGNVALLSVDEGIVRLQFQGSCHGCPSSAQTLKGTIEEAIYDKAPDVVKIILEGEESESPELVAANGNGHSSVALPILSR